MSFVMCSASANSVRSCSAVAASDTPRRPHRLALAQNFPTPILAALVDFIVDIELVPLRRIDCRLSSLDDRALVVALQQSGFQGLVTNNSKVLKNPKELAAIVATKLTVFATFPHPPGG